MARHARSSDPRRRFARAVALAVIWIGGLGAGFYAILATATRASCGPSSHGLACRPAGTAVGGALVVAIIAIVTVVSVATHDVGQRRLQVCTGVGVIALVLCYLGASALIGTA